MQAIFLSLMTLGLAALLLAPVGVVPAAAAECQLVLGFKTLHDLIPNIVGDCLENEHFEASTGNTLQRTSGGLLVWRKADNWTAFTDGTTTWINGPFGLVSRLNEGPLFSWEAAAPPVVVIPPSPPSVPPDASALVQLAIADAVARTGAAQAAVSVLSVEAREWSNSSLGCPQPGQMYAQVIMPGFLIVLEAASQRLEYHTDRGTRIVLC